MKLVYVLRGRINYWFYRAIRPLIFFMVRRRGAQPTQERLVCYLLPILLVGLF